MTNCNLASTSRLRKELLLNQPAGKPLRKEDRQRYQAIMSSMMYHAHVTRHDIMYTVNQPSRAMFKLSKAHMTAAEHLLRYLAGTTDFAITYKQGGFTLTVFVDAN